jgi:hypothetical protein
VTNFAWANPSTGVRRQEATLEAARHFLWHELQIATKDFLPTHSLSGVIYEQERAGVVAESSVNFEIEGWWPGGYGYASPIDGKRQHASCWVDAVEGIRADLAEIDSPVEVIVYRQRSVATVHSTDPEPAAPAPAPPPDDDTPSSLIRDVMAGTCYDLGRAQLLALLWIAEMAMEREGRANMPYRARNPHRRHRRARREGGLLKWLRSLWESFWWPVQIKGDDWSVSAKNSADAIACVEMLTKFEEDRPKRENTEKPHVFSFSDGELCGECGLPMDHPTHGYTGD